MRKSLSLDLFFTAILFSMVTLNGININPLNQYAYAHIFTTNETALFVAFVYQLQVESELVQTNLANNNVLQAQNHASKAAALLTPSRTIEIAEGNQRIADDLRTKVNELHKISLLPSEQQEQLIDQRIHQINGILEEVLSKRFEQQRGNSNLIDRGIEILRDMFGGDQQKADNSQIKLLAFADLIDSVLTNYGDAYAVGFDMTNISNMILIRSNNISSSITTGSIPDNDNMNMSSMNMSSTMNTDREINKNFSLVDMTDYESAQALAIKATEIFNEELKSISSNSNKTVFITMIEDGLTQLDNSIKDKASPLDIMMIVHTQIHPNLLKAFNLELRKT